MPEDTAIPELPEAFTELQKAGQCLDGKSADDVSGKIKAVCEAHTEVLTRLQKQESLLARANDLLDRRSSVFPGTKLHEDIHLAVTGKRL